MTEAITLETRTIVAEQIRRVYARRWSWVDPRDIEQQAHLVMLEALARPPEVIEHPRAFLLGVVSRELVLWLWKQSKPITVTRWAVRESQHHLALYAAMVCERYRDQAVGDLAEEIERAQWIAKVQARIRELIDDDESEVLSILLGEKKPREVYTKKTKRAVYLSTYRMRKRLRDDATLQGLWRDCQW